jgi:hypothetical protein
MGSNWEAIVPGTYEEKCNYIKELEQIVLLCVSGTNAALALMQLGTNACIQKFID